MPDLDGWTVLAAIKGDPALADIPVILLTIVDEKIGALPWARANISLSRSIGTSSSVVLRQLCTPLGGSILVVDDDQISRAGLRNTLQQAGWQVAEADNGQIALTRLNETRPERHFTGFDDAGDGRIRIS